MVWRKIKGFDNYSISTSGIVINNQTLKVKKSWLNSNHQKTVTLSKDKKYNRIIDRLLFETFGINVYESTEKSIKLQINYNNKLINTFN